MTRLHMEKESRIREMREIGVDENYIKELENFKIKALS